MLRGHCQFFININTIIYHKVLALISYGKSLIILAKSELYLAFILSVNVSEVFKNYNFLENAECRQGGLEKWFTLTVPITNSAAAWKQSQKERVKEYPILFLNSESGEFTV